MTRIAGKAGELARAEADVRAGEEQLAGVRNEMKAPGSTISKTELEELEREQARRIERRNALFREVADNDY